MASGAGDATIVNTTISGNLASTAGGIRYSGGDSANLSLNFVTVANNAGAQSGGIATLGDVPLPRIAHTILAGNRLGSAPAAQASDCKGSLLSAGYNLVETELEPDVAAAASKCSLACEPGKTKAEDAHWCASDEVSTEDDPVVPKFKALSAQGFHELEADSPAVNAVPHDDCVPLAAGDPSVAVDQRGTRRTPDDGPQCACDIGAYERPLPDGDGDEVIDCDDPCPKLANRPLKFTQPGTACSADQPCAIDQVCKTLQCVLRSCA